MRRLAIILIAYFTWTACKSPTFSYVNKVDTVGLVPINLDSTYDLYLRTICKDARNRPVNCNPHARDTVEVSYIILSTERENVIVINNNPNRNQRFFKKEKMFKRTPRADLTEINVFYFKQFRFGEVDGNSTSLRFAFETAEKHSRSFLWTCGLVADSLEISSVSEVLPDGVNSRFSSSSLFLIPKFVRSDSFKFVFRLPPMLGEPKITSPPCKIYIDKKSRTNYVTYFQFDQPVYKDYHTIKFGRKRMYAYPMSKKQ